MAATAQLDRELETFNRHRDRLVAESLGKFVVISGDEIVGVWETYADALHAGYERFGTEQPFMVRQVRGMETVQSVYRGSISAC